MKKEKSNVCQIEREEKTEENEHSPRAKRRGRAVRASEGVPLDGNKKEE